VPSAFLRLSSGKDAVGISRRTLPSSSGLDDFLLAQDGSVNEVVLDDEAVECARKTGNIVEYLPSGVQTWIPLFAFDAYV